MHNSLAALVLALVAGFVAGCGSGFESAKSLASPSSSGGSAGAGNGGSGAGGVGTGTDGATEVAMDGAISGGRFDKTKVVQLDMAAKLLIIRLPFIPGILLGAQAQAPLDGIAGATIGLESNPDGSSSLVLRLPLTHALRGIATLPKGRLPNGDKLPAIPEGELPSLSFAVERTGTLRGAVYLGPTVVGLFVTTKFNPFISLTLPIRNESRTQTYGYFSTIPEKTGFDGGFFLSVALPAELARAIDDQL